MTTFIPPSTAAAALAAKQLAPKNRSKRNLVLLAGILLSALALAAYLMLVPSLSVGPGALLVSVTLGAFSAGLVLIRFSRRLTPALAQCLSCGRCWEGRSVPHAEYMPNWDKCPGCGMPMGTEFLERLVHKKSNT